MAAKRQATSNLNHDNWDQEEEPEDRGTFKAAPPEELKTRVIKKATRRKAGVGGLEADEAATDSPKSSVFSGFSGFGKPAASATAGAASPFAFLSKVPAAPFTSADTTSKPAAAAGKEDAKWTPPPAKLFSFDIKNDSKSGPLAMPTSSASAKTSSDSIFGNATTTDATASPKPSVSMFKASVSPSVNSGQAETTVSLEYRDSVAELNMAVMKFLQEHMDKNPYCILTPVFNSYDKYLKQIQEKTETTTSTLKQTVTQSTCATTAVTSTSLEGFSFGKPTSTIGNSSTSPSTSFGKKPNCTVTSGGTTTTATAPLFSFGNVQKANSSPTKSEATTSAATPAVSSIFSFGVKPSTTVANKEDTPKPSFFSFGTKDASSSEATAAISPPKTNGFSFGLKSDDKPSTSGFSGFGKPSTETMMPPTTGFSFGSTSTTPFSFGSLKPPSPLPAGNDAADAGDEEEDRPPKVEFTQVVEDDAIFSKRCKVFVKKDKDFTDRGVGTLYLKPVKDSEKTQMLVRADTNLGKILINLILSEGIPSQRMGKNNVMMVCVPTPEETKPVSILLRVKTGEEADELLEKIKKHTV